MRKIKVLVVEDSLVFRELLIKNLNLDPGLEVVFGANDPFEARDAILKYKPDVMTLDIELPKMDGIEFLRKLMPQYPLPVVMISSLSDKVFDALQAGAVDFVAKPQMTDRSGIESFIRNELPVKIKIAATAKLNKPKAAVTNLQSSLNAEKVKDKIIAIGASTGGTEAILDVIKGFKRDIPGVIVVQHMPEGFTDMYAKRLDKLLELDVREAKQGDKIIPGQVLIAPGGDKQLRVVNKGGVYQVELKKEAKVSGHCPSVDVMFESVAKAAGPKAIGIILTGMGADGSKGLLKMRNAGALTIGQDKSTCVVYGMPRVAMEIGAVQCQEKLQDIAKRTYTLINKL